MSLAVLADVETSLLRPLLPVEVEYVSSLLTRAETLLSGFVPQLLARPDADADYCASTVSTEADMVARVLRNPAGIVHESQGDYSYRIDLAVSSGHLMPTDLEVFHLRRESRTGTVFGSLDAYARARFGWGSGVHPFRCGG